MKATQVQLNTYLLKYPESRISCKPWIWGKVIYKKPFNPIRITSRN